MFKGRKSVILGVWAALGAPETLPKGGELRPPPFARVSGAPGAAQTPKMTDFRPTKNYKFPPKVQPRNLAVLKMIFNFVLGPGGPGGGSRLPFS